MCSGTIGTGPALRGAEIQEQLHFFEKENPYDHQLQSPPHADRRSAWYGGSGRNRPGAGRRLEEHGEVRQDLRRHRRRFRLCGARCGARSPSWRRLGPSDRKDACLRRQFRYQRRCFFGCRHAPAEEDGHQGLPRADARRHDQVGPRTLASGSPQDGLRVSSGL